MAVKQIKLVDVPKSELRMVEVGLAEKIPDREGWWWDKTGGMPGLC